MIYAIYEDDRFAAEIEYAFSILLQSFESDCVFMTYREALNLRSTGEDLVISYGMRPPDGSPSPLIHIYQGDLFGKRYLSRESLPREPAAWFADLPVFYPGRRGRPESVVFSGGGNTLRLESDIDLVASTLYCLARYEEVVSPGEDGWGRFPASASFASRAGFLRLPVVNGYIGLLQSWLGRCAPTLRLRRPWGRHDFAACITHDVDTLQKFRRDNSWAKIARVALVERDPCEAWERILARLGREPYDTFEYILDLDRDLGLKSTLYFLAGEDGEPDPSYRLDSERVTKLIRRLMSGAEVGLHGGFSSFNNPSLMAEEKQRLDGILGGEAKGIRQHYLRFQAPLTWCVQEAAGLLYDTTLSFAEEEGFRAGICTPFHPFDVRARKQLKIWEVPLTLMDATLFEYRKLRPEESFPRIKTLIDTVRRYQGVFVLLWHNSTLDERKYPGVRRLYSQILAYLHSLDPFAGSVGEIVQQWARSGNRLRTEG